MFTCFMDNTKWCVMCTIKFHAFVVCSCLCKMFHRMPACIEYLLASWTIQNGVLCARLSLVRLLTVRLLNCCLFSIINSFSKCVIKKTFCDNTLANPTALQKYNVTELKRNIIQPNREGRGAFLRNSEFVKLSKNNVQKQKST
jgi:hypothetical protein